MHSGRRASGACRGYLLGVVLSLVAGQAAPQSNPGIRVHMHGDEGYAADGLLYRPSAEQRPAALLLIPDERGLTRTVTDAATNFVDAGYVVVAVDLNRGLTADMATRTDEQVDHDLKSALAFVCAQAHVTGDHVGFIAWASGGGAGLRLAGASDTRAVAINGVAPLQAYANLAATKASILGSFAGRSTDHALPSPKELDARLHKLGQSVDTKVYADAERGFDDPDDPAHFKPADAADILSRQKRFFDAKLGR